MPSIMLRGVDAGLVALIRSYARRHGLTLPQAALALIRRGLVAEAGQ